MALERRLNKMRSLTSLRLSTTSTSTSRPDERADDMAPTFQFAPAHSRDSSSASNSSSPMTPSFSSHSHGRWPSSSSSLATSPDSPINAPKAALEDLVEEAAEREDLVGSFEQASFVDEPLCICELYD
jgi:hypothetical protein